ncbi:hypothetical protein CJF32_00002485 [Rutstroemia sp. NJR-2017a WRK4]|nr:hypothetical protein CJF32_00002485 [Rutstroemia sp. NJR-2017a WRK4]
MQFLTLFSFIPAALAYSNPICYFTPCAHTSSGLVAGHTAANRHSVTEYLGIPFAQPPIAHLRFAAPQPYIGTGFINGTDFFGSTAAEIYNGARIADEEDIIVVSLNYRVGVFGFPGALDPQNPVKNLGLLDQRLALEWVRDNIGAFGGDPERITLAGQSAGAISVDYHSYAYSHDPIVSGMILQSGTAQAPSTGASSISSPLEIWIDLATKLNCTSSPSDTSSSSASASASAILHCMRSPSLTTSTILSIAHLYPSSFTPIVDNLTVFPTSLYPSLTPAPIPLLIGSTDNEGEIFAARTLMTDAPLNDTAKDALTRESFTCPAAVRARVSGAKIWRYRYFGDFEELRLRRRGGSAAYHVGDVYMVFGNWAMGDWKPVVMREQERVGRYMRGAWGAFVREPERGLSGYRGVRGDVDEESTVRELRNEGNSQRVMKLGDEDEMGGEVEGRGWPTYEEGRKTLVRLGWENRVGANLGWPRTYDEDCSH